MITDSPYKFSNYLIEAIKDLEIFHYYVHVGLPGREYDNTSDYYIFCYNGDTYLKSCFEMVLNSEGYGKDYISKKSYTVFEYDKYEQGKARIPRIGLNLTQVRLVFQLKMWFYERILPFYSISEHITTKEENKCKIFPDDPFKLSIEVNVMPKEYEHQTGYVVKIRLIQRDSKVYVRALVLKNSDPNFSKRKSLLESSILKTKDLILNIEDDKIDEIKLNTFIKHIYYDDTNKIMEGNTATISII